MLFAEKKGRGGLCLCVDYCSLNTNTVTYAWILPHIDDLLSQLKGPRVFSSWIYGMVIIRYQLILMIDIKWHLHTAMGSMSIQLCHLALKMHQLISNIT